jgi:hypothetical protein
MAARLRKNQTLLAAINVSAKANGYQIALM